MINDMKPTDLLRCSTAIPVAGGDDTAELAKKLANPVAQNRDRVDLNDVKNAATASRTLTRETRSRFSSPVALDCSHVYQ